MNQTVSPIIKASELLLLRGNPNLVLLDASASTKDARDKYNTKHLEGAQFVDLNTQLADIKADAAQGGRHPLPDLKKFSETLGQMGITTDSHVVVYDDKSGANAGARCWWMLKAIGHQQVQVLDGGFEAASKAGFPVSDTVVTPEPQPPYKIDQWMLPLADIAAVDTASTTGNALIIDVRDTPRFNGETEPIDLIAGHIPGATNIPFGTNLDSDGLFLSPEVLKAKYQKAFHGLKSDQVIVHCGSGVTACHTLLAIAQSGLEIPKLYVGSWSEWSRNEKPMITLA